MDCTHLVGMRMHVTEDFVGRMSALFRILLNPRQIVFDSNINTWDTFGAACANKKAESKTYFIDWKSLERAIKISSRPSPKLTIPTCIKRHDLSSWDLFSMTNGPPLSFCGYKRTKKNELRICFNIHTTTRGRGLFSMKDVTYLAGILTIFKGTKHLFAIDWTTKLSLAFCEWNRWKTRVSQVIRIFSSVCRVSPSHGNDWLTTIVV